MAKTTTKVNAKKSTDSISNCNIEEVKIGNQIWMTENLNVSTFLNGDAIQEVKSDQEWEKAANNSEPAWCYYSNEENNGLKYGKLYNWFAVIDPRGLAPAGWHVPTDSDWTVLTEFLGGEKLAGRKMKFKDGWNENSSGNNKSGFSGLPGGCRMAFGLFENISTHIYWWSSTEMKMPLGGDTRYAWSRYLFYKFHSLERHTNTKGSGLYVRCIR